MIQQQEVISRVLVHDNPIQQEGRKPIVAALVLRNPVFGTRAFNLTARQFNRFMDDAGVPVINRDSVSTKEARHFRMLIGNGRSTVTVSGEECTVGQKYLVKDADGNTTERKYGYEADNKTRRKDKDGNPTGNFIKSTVEEIILPGLVQKTQLERTLDNIDASWDSMGALAAAPIDDDEGSQE